MRVFVIDYQYPDLLVVDPPKGDMDDRWREGWISETENAEALVLNLV